MLSWLLSAGVGPAAVSVPVNWAADALAKRARRWFRRVRRTDGLSRLVKAATEGAVELSDAEFDAVRTLLEDQSTWTVPEVDELAAKITFCLSSRAERPAGASVAAGLAIARGLLEFASSDLDPGLFQKVLLARLHRMQNGDADALDEALLSLHADIAAGFSGVMEQLKRVLDRLPPGPAGVAEVAVYLRALVDWVNKDPWPQDQQFKGPQLVPTAVEVNLRVSVTGRDAEVLDADYLVDRCKRLVILGAPGTGKTWLARRVVRRCAEEGLEAIAAGAGVDEIELPLYTTCSRLFTTAGDIRNAAVSSAVDNLGDLGGARISSALRMFFAERSAAVVLVIDSLDEAHGPDDRLRQADSLPWRVVLTSRPSSWHQQLGIENGNKSHAVGELQPLRYPEDVEHVIRCWFADRPDQGADLIAQIARRSNQQRAAAVPLILAFYCIIGGREALPESRSGLYNKVIKRLLTGRWRGTEDHLLDTDTCLRTLRAWAWSGAASDPFSGLGIWQDVLFTERSLLGNTANNALDHIAAPIGPPDLDNGKTPRQFIHRSVHEHLVAEYVASLDAAQAAKILLPHLWFDPDWEYAAPAAVAMHPDRNQVLRDLICRAARSTEVPDDLAAIDIGWEFRSFLARVASESSQSDWSSESGEIIEQARVDLADSGHVDNLGGAASWKKSNSAIRRVLLQRYFRPLHVRPYRTISEFVLVRGVTQLFPDEEEKRQALSALLNALGSVPGRTSEIRNMLIQLAPTAEERSRARNVLLKRLAQLEFTSMIGEFTAIFIQLAPTADDKRQARQILLGHLAARHELGSRPRRQLAPKLARAICQLDPTPEDKRRVREALLSLVVARAWYYTFELKSLTAEITRLAPTDEDKRQARQMLLGQVAIQGSSDIAAGLAQEVARLAPPAKDRSHARMALLGVLGEERHDLSGPSHPANEDLIPGLVMDALVELAVTAQERLQTIEVLLSALADPVAGWSRALLTDGIVRLAVTTAEKRQVRDILLGFLPQVPAWDTIVLLAGTLKVSTTAVESRRALDALLEWIEESRRSASEVTRLSLLLPRLDTTDGDNRRLQNAVLVLINNDDTDSFYITTLVEWLSQFLVTSDAGFAIYDWLLRRFSNGPVEDRAKVMKLLAHVLRATPGTDTRIRDALLRQLSYDGNALYVTLGLGDMVLKLSPTAEDKQYIRNLLLRLFGNQRSYDEIVNLAQLIAKFDPTPEEMCRARHAMMLLLESDQAAKHQVLTLAALLSRFDATIDDHRCIRNALLRLFEARSDSLPDPGGRLEIPETIELVTAIRRHSALTEWLAFLPSRDAR